MSDEPRLIVDLVSDPVCPWCFVGVKSLFAAKRALEAERDIVVRFRAYQLNPNTPLSGVDREAHYAKKFPDPAYRDQMRAQLIKAAEDVGAPFDPGLPKHLPNTLAAHRVLHWAHYEGAHERFADRLYEAFWHEGADIGDADSLAEIGAEAGLDRDRIAEDLASGRDAEKIAQEAEAFRTAGVSGVPTFIVNERTGFSGAVPPQALAQALQQAEQTTRAQ